MTERYFAFISYSETQRDWVAVLHRNLERCLDHYSQTVDPSISKRVFLDQVDLVSGKSWIDQFQDAVRRSERLILILSPEALDSAWVQVEWQSFFTQRPKDLFPVHILDTERTAFLDPIQGIDFRNLRGAEYRRRLREFFGDLLRLGRRALPPIPEDLETPFPIEPDPRQQLFEESLVLLLASKTRRRLAASALAIERNSLDPLNGREAARRLTTRKEVVGDTTSQWIGVVRKLIEEFEEEWPNETKPLQQLETDLLEHQAAERQRRVEAAKNSLRQKLDGPNPEGETERQGTQADPVPAYLSKVASDHENLIPLFDHRKAPLLDHVYVELRLSEEGGLESPNRSSLPDSMTIKQVLDLDPREHPWITLRWVILGDPGAGKTTLMRHLARELALERGRKWIPIFESLPLLLREPDSFLERIEAHMRQACEPATGLSRKLESHGKEGNLLIQLDGLDEVPRNHKARAHSLLRQLSSRWPKSPILVTSRPIGFESPSPSFLELEILPFDRSQQILFLSQWLGGDRAKVDQTIAAIDTYRSVRDLAGNPLYLTLMAILVEQDIHPSDNRSRLYDQIFNLLLEGRHKRPILPIPLQADSRAALRQLAYSMTVDNIYSEPIAAIEKRFWSDKKLLRLARPLIRRWGDARPFLDEMSEKTCILGPHDGPTSDWRYWHRSFREALAAESLELRYRSGGQDAILDSARELKGDESRWAEAFALLSGRVENPDALVVALVETNRLLGLRAVATAPVLKPETIARVLSLSKRWTDRATVFLQIPKLLSDPHTTISLIDRLRKETRDGNDLFHLDLALQLVGAKWSEFRRRILALRRDLYDHIPAPQFQHFSIDEGPWGVAPPGISTIGSGAYGVKYARRSSPQFRTVFETGFRMMNTPVTQAQFQGFDPDHKSSFKGASRPVESVTWFQSVSFCRWLSTHEPFAGARLPLEEEWEYACRGGGPPRLNVGSYEKELRRIAWVRDNAGGRTHEVRTKASNPWGLYDMLGNVWEWTLSQNTFDYSGRQAGRTINSQEISRHAAKPSESQILERTKTKRIVRGGSFWDLSSLVQPETREDGIPGAQGRSLGFRFLLPPESPTTS